MIAALGLVVVEVVLDELRRIGGEFIGYAARKVVSAGAIVCRPFFCKCLTKLVATFGIKRIKVTVDGYATHVVHGRSNGGLDADVDSGGVDRHAAPTADAENADFVRIDVLSCGEIVDSGRKIFSVDVARSYITGITAAFSGK